MEVCANCGHQLGVGRFCTNCGTRVDQQPPPSGPPTLPPPAVEPPSQARYPLFADDVQEPAPAYVPPPPAAEAPVFHPVVRPTVRVARPPRRSPGGWLTWVVGGVALLLVAMIGALLLLDDDDDAGDGDTARDRADTATTTEPSSPATSEKPPKLPQPSNDSSGDGPLDLARYAAVDVPDTAPPNVDVSGNQVRYEAENMLDGVPATCWRMPGSGADEEIVFSFREPVQLSEVGLINGYAKTSGDLDWYTGNRRVLEVEWVFDDGSSVEQTLDATRDLQALPIKPVTTSTVILRLVDVSEPGGGRSARNYTAISDVSLVGEPG